MKILILSDTHGHLHPAILELATGCEHIVHCGDIGNAAVLDHLAEHAPVTAVRGNNDLEALWAEKDLSTLTPLPWEIELTLPGGTLGICHGHQEPSVSRRHAYLRKRFHHCRAVAYGHSHRLVVDEESPDCQVINPGAAGKTRTYGGPSCLLLSASKHLWSFEPFRFRL